MTVRVTLFDYGTGNIHSLAKALARGADVRVETDPARVTDGDALVLPGVGAFGAVAERLAPAAPAIRSAIADGLPCLGVCLGMQLLFDGSEESDGAGLGIVPGRARRVRAARVPHMGWNTVEPAGDDPVLDRPLMAYYANSYVCDPADPAAVVAWTEYEGDRFAAAVRRDRCWGVQFHPEKSDRDGLALIDRWLAAVST